MTELWVWCEQGDMFDHFHAGDYDDCPGHRPATDREIVLAVIERAQAAGKTGLLEYMLSVEP